MESVIIYFSQTGNTQRVAKAICDSIRKANGQCDIMKLKEASVPDLLGYDLLGIGCPFGA